MPFPGHFPLQCRSPLLLSPCHGHSEPPSLLTCSLNHFVCLQICCFHCRIPVNFFCLLPSSFPITKQAAVYAGRRNVGISKSQNITDPSTINDQKRRRRRNQQITFCYNEMTKNQINLKLLEGLCFVGVRGSYQRQTERRGVQYMLRIRNCQNEPSNYHFPTSTSLFASGLCDDFGIKAAIGLWRALEVHFR